LGKYKRLKSQLTANKPGGEDRRAATPTTADRSAAGGAQPELIKAIEDLKLFVQQEFRAIRAEIRKLSEAIGTDSRSYHWRRRHHFRRKKSTVSMNEYDRIDPNTVSPQ